MKVLVIEDEIPARAKLKQMLLQLDRSIVVIGELSTVKESVDWLANNSAPDVAFVDIQLADDHSFEIFKRVAVSFPLIFTTAYDKYLMDSFEHHAIDYLLKPITEEKLRRSLQKLQSLKEHFLGTNLPHFLTGKTAEQKRIVARKGSEYVVLPPEAIAYFYTEHKIVFAKNTDGKKFIIDHTLAELEGMVDATTFFRLNRKYLAGINAIEKFRSDNGKIQVTLQPGMEEDIFVSKETAPLFRQWIGKK